MKYIITSVLVLLILFTGCNGQKVDIQKNVEETSQNDNGDQVQVDSKDDTKIKEETDLKDNKDLETKNEPTETIEDNEVVFNDEINTSNTQEEENKTSNDEINTPNTQEEENKTSNDEINTSNTQDDAEEELTSRSYYMGFSTWAAGTSIEDLEKTNNLINKKADIVSYHFDNGIPWVEAYNHENYSDNLLNNWAYKNANIKDNQKVFVSITPISFSRDQLAAYWGENEGMELPSEWKDLEFNDEKVKTAFLNYAKDVIENLNPDYLALGIEVNLLSEKDPEKWEKYKELYKETYDALKSEYPNLKIFATVGYETLSDKTNEKYEYEKKEIEDLCSMHCDLIGISVYPYFPSYWKDGQRVEVPETFFDNLLEFNKPLAISETGFASKNFVSGGTTFELTEKDQVQYFEVLLDKANEYDFEFIINWANVDFDGMLEVIPEGPTRDLATVWAYSGLQNYDGTDKEVVELWDKYFELEVK